MFYNLERLKEFFIIKFYPVLMKMLDKDDFYIFISFTVTKSRFLRVCDTCFAFLN